MSSSPTPSPTPIRLRWWSRMVRAGRSRPARTAAVTGLALTVVAVVAAGLAALRADTGIDSFLPAGDPTVTALDQAASSFGADPIVVVAESAAPGAALGPHALPILIRLEGQLSRLPDVAVVYGPGTVLNQIAAAGQRLLAEISGERDAIIDTARRAALAQGASAQAAQDAGLAAVSSFDQRYGSLLVSALPVGLPTLRNPEFVHTVVFDNNGQPRPQWRFIVPAPNAVSILIRPRQHLDQAGTQRLVAAVNAAVHAAGLPTTAITVSGAPALTAALGDQVRREGPLLGILAIILIALCYLLSPWQPRRRTRLLPLLATLGSTVLVLAVIGWSGRPLSLAVIAFLPILVGIGSDFPAYLLHGASPRRVLVTAAASAAGFAALAVSPLPFVRDLGIALGAGVLVAAGLALLMRRALPVQPSPTVTSRRAQAPTVWPITGRLATIGALGLVAALGWVLLPQLPIDAQPDHLAAGLPAVADAHHVQDIVGSSGQIQITVRGPNVLTPRALAWMDHAQAVVARGYGGQLRPIIGLPDLLRFLGPHPSQAQLDAAMRALPSYLTGAAVSPDNDAAAMSFGVQFQDLGTQQRWISTLKDTLPTPPAGLRSDVVGLPVAAARAYQLIAAHRYLTNTVGIVVAGLVLLLGLRHRSDALRAILACALATGWGFTLAWLLGTPLTPLTVALGSLTTATASEFTVMLTTARHHDAGLRRTVTVAALAAGLGYAALTASHLTIIQQFGLTLASTVALSYLAAQLVTRTLPPRDTTVVRRTCVPTRFASQPCVPTTHALPSTEVVS